MIYNTEKRAELLDFLKRGRGQAFSIEEICAAILNDGHGKSTVYRLISKLVDEGEVRRIADGKTRHVTYQYIHSGHCAEHLHLKCKECGKLIHLDGELSSALEERILKTKGFMLDLGALLYGKCEKCIYREAGGTK